MNPPKTTRATGARLLKPTRVALALLVLARAARVAPVLAGDGERGPDLEGATEITVPAGNRVAFHVYAEGVQIYRWDGASWAFVAPDAVLFADGVGGNGVVGHHSAGPAWESNSGSKVVGTVDKRATPDPDAIQWLRLKAASHAGAGIFDNVTYIQRVNTVGGLAPTEPGALGDEAQVPYTADYYFYRAHP